MLPSPIQMLKFMPAGWEQKCRELGIIQRVREIKTPEDLMTLDLFHLLHGCTLLEMSVAAKALKIGNISDVAFMKKFEKCGEWFKWCNAQMSPQSIIEYTKPKFLENYRVTAFDATEVVEKGKTGRRHRLHYAIDIFKMQLISNELTDVKTGETLCNFNFKKGDLAIGDRIYGTQNGAEHCLKNGADFLLRWRSNSSAMYDENGERIDITKLFAHLNPEEYGEIKAFFKTQNCNIPIRICVRRKTESQYKKSIQKLKTSATRHRSNTKNYTKEFGKYIVIVTSLPDNVSAEEILETYRYRWQIEIYFKRLKSILDFGDLPKKRKESSITWINGKLLVVLLIESWIAAMAFSPKAKRRESQSLARDEND